MIIQSIDATEAREHTDEIRKHLSEIARCEDRIRELLLLIYQSDGWQVLGYESFQTWAQGEFNQSWQHAYRLVTAAQVDQELTTLSGESHLVPVTHAQELSKLVEPKQRHRAYEIAQELADTERVQLAKRHIRRGVEQVQAEIAVKSCDYPVVRHLVADGAMTARQGQSVAEALEDTSPRIQVYLQELIQKAGVAAELIPHLAEMAERRGTPKQSKVLETIERTGYVGDTPLGRATLADLEAAKEEARLAHIAEGEEAKRQRLLKTGERVPEPVIVTLWKGDPQKTLREMQRVLGDEFDALKQLILKDT